MKDGFAFGVKGYVVLEFVDKDGEVLHSAHNDLTDQVLTVFMNSLRGQDRISYIDIGSGGDVSPVTGADTGQKVPPVATETAIREKLFKANVSWTNIDGNILTFMSAISPEEFVNSNINECALMTDNGVMASHWVSPADSLGKATKYVKTEFAWLNIKWNFEFVLRIL